MWGAMEDRCESGRIRVCMIKIHCIHGRNSQKDNKILYFIKELSH